MYIVLYISICCNDTIINIRIEANIKLEVCQNYTESLFNSI